MELGMGEILIVLAIFMVLFGANKLPQLGKGLGEAIRNFKSGMKDGLSDEPPRKAEPPALPPPAARPDAPAPAAPAEKAADPGAKPSARA